MSIKRIVLSLLLTKAAFCAIPATTVWELNASATASNVNGGGFDYANANFPTDYTATSATGTAAVLASASYNFVAGDVNAWVYIKTTGTWGAAGTTGCFYQIASVASNQATLNSGTGQGVCIDGTKGYPSPKWVATTAAGVSSTGSPTGGVVGIDYSQGTAAAVTFTDLVIGGTTTQVTSVLNPIGVNYIGNNIHINSGTGCTQTWYNVASVATITATLDKSAGTAASSCGAKMGGAMSLNSTLDDDLFEMATATNGTGANRFFVKQGTYTLGESVSTAASGGTQAPIIVEGYTSLRGDAPTGSTRPTWTAGNLSVTAGTNWDFYSLIVSTAATSINTFALGTSGKMVYVKVVNTGSQNAIATAPGNYLFGVEAISYRSSAISTSTNDLVLKASYLHDSQFGISTAVTSNYAIISDTIIEGMYTNAFRTTAAATGPITLDHVTIYGAENKLGTCVLLATGTTNIHVTNSIVYGCATGVSHADTQSVAFTDYNDMFNNTNDVSASGQWQKGSHSLALDPQFTNVVQRTGSTATTTSGNHLVQTGATFVTWGIVPGRDFLYVVSGTGVTVGVYGIASVDSETQITTDVALTANATGDKVWQITTGHDFSIGANLKAAGYPGSFPGALTTAYNDIGGVQRQEPNSGGTQRGYSIIQ